MKVRRAGVFFMALVLVWALTACGGERENGDKSDENALKGKIQVKSSEELGKEEGGDSQNTEDILIGDSFSIGGKYDLTITHAYSLLQEDTNLLVLEYSFKNKDENPVNPIMSVVFSPFVENKKLEVSAVFDDRFLDATALDDIPVGETKEINYISFLYPEKGDVELQVQELMGQDGKTVKIPSADIKLVESTSSEKTSLSDQYKEDEDLIVGTGVGISYPLAEIEERKILFPESVTILDDEGIKASMVHSYYVAKDGLYIEMEITNTTEKDLMFDFDTAYIDDIAFQPWAEGFSVPAGETVDNVIKVASTDWLEVLGLKEVYRLEFSGILYSEEEQYPSRYYTKSVELTVPDADTKDDSLDFLGKVVYFGDQYILNVGTDSYRKTYFGDKELYALFGNLSDKDVIITTELVIHAGEDIPVYREDYVFKNEIAFLPFYSDEGDVSNYTGMLIKSLKITDVSENILYQIQDMEMKKGDFEEIKY